jgi:hypothetical protein
MFSKLLNFYLADNQAVIFVFLIYCSYIYPTKNIMSMKKETDLREQTPSINRFDKGIELLAELGFEKVDHNGSVAQFWDSRRKKHFKLHTRTIEDLRPLLRILYRYVVSNERKPI